MDFSKQCKRFLNFRVINQEATKKRFTNIAAFAVLKKIYKEKYKEAVCTYKFVVHDNEERCTYIIDETSGEILAELDKKLRFESYGICCSSNPNIIYVSDFTNNKIRKFDENLKEIGQLELDPKVTAHLNGPCQITVNSFLQKIHIVDQRNCRVIIFDLKTGEYHSEFKLFEEDLAEITKKPVHSFRMDLTNKLKGDDYIDDPVGRAMMDFKPFGIYSKLERIYITDWNRGLLYMYKNNQDNVYRLERKITGKFSKPRDILLDSLDSMLVSDMDCESFFFLDNKGVYLFETPIPKVGKSGTFFKEKGVFGITKLPDKIVFASNSTIYILLLSTLIEE